jgi:hypothetical protein
MYMYAALMTLLLLSSSSTLYLAEAADVPPVPPLPSAPPSDKSAPPPNVEPSPRDPGIVKKPEIVPDQKSVVTPPIVDPKMPVNPDAPTEEQRHPTLPPPNTQPSPPQSSPAPPTR